jgi:DNA modification methylase
MRTFLVLAKQDRPRPDGPERDTYPAALVEAFLREYTTQGEVVLDPFAGFGTTLDVASAMGRRSIGIEILEDRASFIAGRISEGATLIRGDSRRIDELGLEPVDFVMTSPPYMCRNDPQDPLQGYAVPGGGYDAYLAGLADIFRRVRTVLKPDRVAVVNVSNLKRYDGLTMLAWDVADAISQVMALEGEVVIGWNDDEHAFNYDHEYCLIFRNA